jgi:hypothetical protein
LNLRLAHYLEAALMGTLDRRGVGAGASSRSRYFIGFSLTYGSRGRGMMLPLNGLAR